MTAKPSQLRTVFDTYSVNEQIGQGGCGRVFRVTNVDQEEFAAKILDPRIASRSRLKRFKNELEFCASTQHPNIVPVVDWGVENQDDQSISFYVMPYFDTTLRRLVGQELDEETLLSLTSQILDGVEAAHLRGVWHRDLKPENLLFDSQNANLVVADFGIAHFTESELRTLVKTSPKDRLANFRYAAPEQREGGQTIDQRTDIYSAGVIINELFTGTLIHGSDPRRIGNSHPDLSYLDAVVDRMVGQRAEDRYTSIDEVKLDLMAKGAEFASRQKVKELEQTVVPTSELDDPLVDNPISVVGVEDYDEGTLTLVLSGQSNLRWEQCLHSIGGYRHVPGIISPALFRCRGDRISIAVPSKMVQQAVDLLKSYIPVANRDYEARVRGELARAEQEAIDRLKKEAEEERVRNQILRDTKV